MRSAKTATLALAATLTLAPAAMASGGVNSGGVNSGGVNSGGGGTTSGGTASGGGTTSGGGTSGGGKVTGPCAQITGLGNSVGYYSTFAAIWTNFAITSNCKTSVSWDMSYHNNATGAVDFERSGVLLNGNTGGTIDEDWAAFSTDYTVTLTVSDTSGNVVTSQSTPVTTPAEKAPGA